MDNGEHRIGVFFNGMRDYAADTGGLRRPPA